MSNLAIPPSAAGPSQVSAPHQEGAFVTADKQILVNVGGRSYNVTVSDPEQTEKICKLFNDSVQNEGGDFQKALHAFAESGKETSIAFHSDNKNYKLFTPATANQGGVQWTSGTKWEDSANKTAKLAQEHIGLHITVKNTAAASPQASTHAGNAQQASLTPAQQKGAKEVAGKLAGRITSNNDKLFEQLNNSSEFNKLKKEEDKKKAETLESLKKLEPVKNESANSDPIAKPRSASVGSAASPKEMSQAIEARRRSASMHTIR